MKYTFEFLKNKSELNEFETKDYHFKKECEFIVARNGEICGLVGFYLKREFYPELKHIYLKEGIARRIGIILISKMEDYFKKQGYKEYVAFIRNDKNNIQQFAQRLNFLPYIGTEKGVWFIKQLDKEKKCLQS